MDAREASLYRREKALVQSFTPGRFLSIKLLGR